MLPVQPQTLFWVGHAKLPRGMPAQSVYDTLGLAVETDPKYFVILRASCTLATAHGQEFISSLLIGFSLLDGIEGPIRVIQERYFGKGKNAIIAALKDLYQDFLEYRMGREDEGGRREQPSRPEGPA